MRLYTDSRNVQILQGRDFISGPFITMTLQLNIEKKPLIFDFQFRRAIAITNDKHSVVPQFGCFARVVIKLFPFPLAIIEKHSK